jgi:HEAT repeat protein
MSFERKLHNRLNRGQTFKDDKRVFGFLKRNGINSSKKIQAILPTVKSRDRELAFWILGQKPDKGSLEVLEKSLRDGNPRTRSLAAWALGMINNARARKLLAERLSSDRAKQVIWESAKGLIRQNAVGFCSMFLEIAKSSVNLERRRAAVYILGNLSIDKSLSILVPLLRNKSEDPRLRGEAAEALGNIMKETAIDSLIEALDDGSVEVRFWSIFALGRLKAKKSLPRLRQILLSDKSTLPGWWSIKKEASEAIRNIKQPG